MPLPAAGALFGAAWWCIVDAICYSKAVLSEGFPWTFALPGVAATVALICMNLISREELKDMTDEQGEEQALVGASLQSLSFLISWLDCKILHN